MGRLFTHEELVRGFVVYIVPKDSRQRYTMESLTDAFLKALETKAVSDITVSEICEDAEVSRKTFYKYYSDQFAFLTALQEDLFFGFTEELKTLSPNIFEITPTLIKFVQKNRVLFRAVIENLNKGGFIDQIVIHLYITYHQEWEELNPGMTNQDVEFLFHYIVYGLVGIIHHWLIDDPHMPVTEVIKRADNLMKLTALQMISGGPNVLSADGSTEEVAAAPGGG